MTADAVTALVAALALVLPILAAALLMWKWPRRRAAPGGEGPGGADAAAYAYAFDRPHGRTALFPDADQGGHASHGGGDGSGEGGD